LRSDRKFPTYPSHLRVPPLESWNHHQLAPKRSYQSLPGGLIIPTAPCMVYLEHSPKWPNCREIFHTWSIWEWELRRFSNMILIFQLIQINPSKSH
jgi:hypothetical protein